MKLTVPGTAACRKRANVNVSLFSPKSCARDAIPVEPDILSNVNCGSGEWFRSADPADELFRRVGRGRSRVRRLNGIQGIASHQFREYRPHRIRMVHQVQARIREWPGSVQERAGEALRYLQSERNAAGRRNRRRPGRLSNREDKNWSFRSAGRADIGTVVETEACPRVACTR
jgi:hypothetical protein